MQPHHFRTLHPSNIQSISALKFRNHFQVLLRFIFAHPTSSTLNRDPCSQERLITFAPAYFQIIAVLSTTPRKYPCFISIWRIPCRTVSTWAHKIIVTCGSSFVHEILQSFSLDLDNRWFLAIVHLLVRTKVLGGRDTVCKTHTWCRGTFLFQKA